MHKEIKSFLCSAVREETIGCFEKTIGCFEKTIGCFLKQQQCLSLIKNVIVHIHIDEDFSMNL